MLSIAENVKTTLFTGPAALSKTFMFEAAIHLAEEGRQVVYITPEPLESLPTPCHDRNDPALAAFKMMRFMYLKNFRILLEQLCELHNFDVVPSGLLIDDMDHYLNDVPDCEDDKVHFSRTCASILDAINACSRISNSRVDLCVWSSSVLMGNDLHFTYFRNIWNVIADVDGKEIILEKIGQDTPGISLFKYKTLKDGTRVLTEIVSLSTD